MGFMIGLICVLVAGFIGFVAGVDYERNWSN